MRWSPSQLWCWRLRDSMESGRLSSCPTRSTTGPDRPRPTTGRPPTPPVAALQDGAPGGSVTRGARRPAIPKTAMEEASTVARSVFLRGGGLVYLPSNVERSNSMQTRRFGGEILKFLEKRQTREPPSKQLSCWETCWEKTCLGRPADRCGSF